MEKVEGKGGEQHYGFGVLNRLSLETPKLAFGVMHQFQSHPWRGSCVFNRAADSARTMRVRRMFATAMLASAMAQAEPLSPRVAERYRQMLAANPTEGIALDRLWKGALEGGTTEELLATYAKAEDFSGRMIFGLLLRKAGRDGEVRKAFESAAKASPR